MDDSYDLDDDWPFDFPADCSDIGQDIVQSSEKLGELLSNPVFDGYDFDIVTHSMGGVVALYWATLDANWNNTNLLRRVHSIITLDSPLKGLDYDFLRDDIEVWLRALLGVAVTQLGNDSHIIKSLSGNYSFNEKPVDHVDVATVVLQRDFEMVLFCPS